MKCPLCDAELKITEKDYRFKGNCDLFADCDNCHHTFIFRYRYGNLWKYDQWEMIYDPVFNWWEAVEETHKTVIVYKGE